MELIEIIEQNEEELKAALEAAFYYVEPDISVICDPQKITEKGCNGAPDWIIEIVSPSSRQMDYYIKLFKYRAAGVKEYWIVDPEKSRIMVYIFSGDFGNEYTFSEHAEMYIDSRGQNGVPGTIRELLDDADAIKAMIGELWKELTGKQPQENENIIEIPCSAGMICAQISGDSNYPGIYTYLRLPDGTEIDICAVEGNEVGELNAYIYENTSSDDWTRKIHYSKDDLNI